MLLALHGFTETDESWHALLAPLAREVRCPLLPGHGWKPCPAGASVQQLAAALAATLPENGADLLGYSMGGRVALQLALDHPRRVRRLALVSCTAGLRDPRERALRRAQDERLAEVLEQDGIGPFVAWWQAHPALRPALPLARTTEQEVRSRRLGQDPHGLAGALRTLGSGAMDDLWPRLPELRIPTLLIAGGDDGRYRALMTEMASLVPQSRMEVIAACGHAPHREQPAALSGLLAAFFT